MALRSFLAFPVLLLSLAAGCATAKPAPTGTGRAVLLAFDDSHVEGTIAFPTMHHEGLVRFELPPGEHRFARLWVQAGAAGALRWAFYEQTPLEGPGQVVTEGQLTVAPTDASNGQDGRWCYVDLSALPAREGVLWVGFKRVDGEPTIAASHVDSGQYYLRSDDPSSPLNLMPVKRTPLVRLELSN